MSCTHWFRHNQFVWLGYMKEKEKIYGKNNTVIGKHLQTWTVFFYCLARTWKKKAINCVIFLIAATFITKSRNQTNSVTKKMVLSFYFSFSFFFLMLNKLEILITMRYHCRCKMNHFFMVFELKNIIRWKIFNYSKNENLTHFVRILCTSWLHSNN